MVSVKSTPSVFQAANNRCGTGLRSRSGCSFNSVATGFLTHKAMPEVIPAFVNGAPGCRRNLTTQ